MSRPTILWERGSSTGVSAFCNLWILQNFLENLFAEHLLGTHDVFFSFLQINEVCSLKVIYLMEQCCIRRGIYCLVVISTHSKKRRFCKTCWRRILKTNDQGEYIGLAEDVFKTFLKTKTRNVLVEKDPYLLIAKISRLYSSEKD